MLVVSREIGEKVVIRLGEVCIEVCIVDVSRQKRVRVGVQAPRTVMVHREEVDRAIRLDVASARKKPAAHPA